MYWLSTVVSIVLVVLMVVIESSSVKLVITLWHCTHRDWCLECFAVAEGGLAGMYTVAIDRSLSFL